MDEYAIRGSISAIFALLLLLALTVGSKFFPKQTGREANRKAHELSTFEKMSNK